MCPNVYRVKSIIGVILSFLIAANPAFGDSNKRRVFSNSGNFMADVTPFTVIEGSIATVPGYIELFNRKGELLFTFKHSLDEAIISSVEFSPNDKLLVSTAKTGGWPFRVRNEDWPSVLGEVRLWDTRTGKLKRALVQPTAQMLQAVFAPNGKTVAITGGDGKIRLWDVPTGKVQRVIPASYTLSLDFAPDSRKLATVVGDKKIRIWDTQTGKIWKIFDATKVDEKAKRILTVTLSSNGKTITSSGNDGKRWWNVKTGQLIKTEPPPHSRQ